MQADFKLLTLRIKEKARLLGFSQVGIASLQLKADVGYLKKWIAQKRHGTMDYMKKHFSLRADPKKILPDAKIAIVVTADYLAESIEKIDFTLHDRQKGYIARYALGRDYHRVMRKRLKVLEQQTTGMIDDNRYKVFVDSVPVLERALARNAGLGWIGKNTNLIHSKRGSFFFIGGLLTNLPLLVDQDLSTNHCGSCSSCMTICPTNAIVAPYQLDARKCIAYLTIEWRGSIPLSLRSMIGNRIFGCDDCQLVCPWNRFSQKSTIEDFLPRHQFESSSLLTLFSYSKEQYLHCSEGMAIRRCGYSGWLRNIAIGLGNAPPSLRIIKALQNKLPSVDALVAEHIDWALAKQQAKGDSFLQGT